MGSVGNAALTAARSGLAIRRQLATTPGRLRLAAALLALGAIVFGVVATRAAGERGDAVQEVRTTEPRLVSAVDLSASLSDAHAIAASSFLVGGPESAASRLAYADSLRSATAGVTQLASEIGSSSAVRSIADLLPVYAGFIENARAYYRQGFPVGSAYLRRANLERDKILLQGRELYRVQATSLTTSYEAGSAGSTTRAVLLAGFALLALLGATQVYLARKTSRIVNLGLALATVLLLGLMSWTLVAFSTQQSHLVKAQRNGSDPIALLTATRILALRAQADESIALAARGGGGGEQNLDDVDKGFEAVTRPIGSSRPGPARGSGGLLHKAALAQDSPKAANAIDAIYHAYRAYLEAHGRVVRREKVGDFDGAVKLAVEPVAKRAARASGPAAKGTCPRADGAASTSVAAAALNCLLVQEIEAARGRFDTAVDSADGALGGLERSIPVLAVLCALLALFGVRQRLEEYR